MSEEDITRLITFLYMSMTRKIDHKNGKRQITIRKPSSMTRRNNRSQEWEEANYEEKTFTTLSK